MARSTKTENSDFLSVVKMPRLIWTRKYQNKQPLVCLTLETDMVQFTYEPKRTARGSSMCRYITLSLSVKLVFRKLLDSSSLLLADSLKGSSLLDNPEPAKNHDYRIQVYTDVPNLGCETPPKKKCLRFY